MKAKQIVKKAGSAIKRAGEATMRGVDNLGNGVVKAERAYLRGGAKVIKPVLDKLDRKKPEAKPLPQPPKQIIVPASEMIIRRKGSSLDKPILGPVKNGGMKDTRLKAHAAGSLDEGGVPKVKGSILNVERPERKRHLKTIGRRKYIVKEI